MKTLPACLLLLTVGSAIAFADHPQFANKLGTVRFEVSGQPTARAHVVTGVKLTHHMMYPEADREFAEALQIDPHCALAHWGRAMTIIHPLWPDAPTDAERKAGAEHIQRGLACPNLTARERGYLETLNRYFDASVPGDHPARLKVLDVAWAELAEKYAADLDATAFAALYHLAPARWVAKDKSHRLQFEAAAQLKKVSDQIPDHPGAQHYKIHAYDFPLLADRALEVCDTYTSIAPDVPHALHMPTHIFTRRGLWDKSIEFNRRSAEAARKLGLQAGALNGHLPHALDYMVYAHLQRGEFAAADAIRRPLAAQSGPYSSVNPGAMAFAFAAIPARYALERQDWAAAAQLPVRQPASFAWGKAYLNCDSIVRFARALGAARSGQREAAHAEIAELEKILRDLSGANRASYWAAQAETQVLAARAWADFKPAKPDASLALMQRAVELEANVDKEAVTPGEVLPAGDLLGDMLLEANRPADALAAFEAVLVASPNRLNSLYGAGLAAERSGRTDKAREYYSQILQVAPNADAGVTRVEHARAYLAGNRVANSR
jgi:tetratricopeptide (TPR) repeat protein